MRRISETREVKRTPGCGFKTSYTLRIEQVVKCADRAEADRAQAEYPSLVDWCDEGTVSEECDDHDPT